MHTVSLAAAVQFHQVYQVLYFLCNYLQQHITEHGHDNSALMIACTSPNISTSLFRGGIIVRQGLIGIIVGQVCSVHYMVLSHTYGMQSTKESYNMARPNWCTLCTCACMGLIYKPSCILF